MTSEQLRQAKVLEEVEFSQKGMSLVLLDMRCIGIVNVFPCFAVYEKRGDSFLFVLGNNEELTAQKNFEKLIQENKKKFCKEKRRKL